ncbi:MAG: hypothetical protein H7X93_12050 [Sphingomonadaceae bacterium]|nr:hypothetical protein [Sphingomonadaceae bacterium]
MKHPASLYTILVAWQAGEFGYREALTLSNIDTLDELYDAAHLSGVPIRTKLLPDEEVMARRVGALLRAQSSAAA